MTIRTTDIMLVSGIVKDKSLWEWIRLYYLAKKAPKSWAE